jgi:hypothetical protein
MDEISFKNKDLPKNLKLTLKNTTINKTLTYPSGTWMLKGTLKIFSPKKTDRFGWERTHDLGYQKPAC